MEIQTIIQSVYPLPATSLNKVLDIVSLDEYPKGHLLIKEKLRNRDLFFIRKGIARIYYRQASEEVNIAFCAEGDWLLSLKSYIEDQPGYENIQLLEPAQIYKIHYDQILPLYNDDIHIANLGRKMAELEILRTEERLISRQLRTAGERYRELIDKHPHLLQRVSLGHIASYLGVSQVTLSRIRAEVK